jgi:hypothetical protein
MKNFDEERQAREEIDRSFVIGGETFTHRVAVAPETIVRWNMAVTEEIELTEQDWLGLYDETIVAMLEPDQVPKWRKVRSPDATHPLTLSDMREVLRFLMERATGRPTSEPSGSTNGSATTETTLRDVSSSPAAPSPA